MQLALLGAVALSQRLSFPLMGPLHSMELDGQCGHQSVLAQACGRM